MNRSRPKPTVREHVRYLERGHAVGVFVASGPTVPDIGAELVLAVGDRADVEAFVAQDPYVRAGLAEWEILTADPSRVDDELAAALSSSAAAAATSTRQADVEWTTDELRGLGLDPTADLAGALADRSIGPALQHVGQLLLTRLAASAGSASASPGIDGRLAVQARRCAAELDERSWPGDEALARELSHAVGDAVGAREPGSPPWPLQPVPVDLFDLADSLDGDPLAGTGYVDLVSGNVLPAGIRDFGDVAEHFPELDEESDDYDPDRWLRYDPESSQGYRDMQDFTASLTDGSLQDRLWRALDGRGAFRRFRDVLHDSRDVHLQRWFVFQQERALGRARLFLAIEGYRAAPPR